MESCWQDNLTAIKQGHPELHARLLAHAEQPVGEIIATPSGRPTLRFLADSGAGGDGPLAYGATDPWQDAAVHLKTVAPDSRGLSVFIGLGLGYGPLRLLEERPGLGMLVIVEPCLDLLVTALRHVDLRPLFKSGKVRWLVGDIDLAALEQMVGRIASLEDTHILRHVASFQWREDLYAPLSHQVFLVVNQLNASGGTTRKAGERFFRNRLANLSLLRHSHELGALREAFAGKPAVLVAAGPSLDQSLTDLKKVAGRCVLLAVDSALAPLVNAGIMPDFVTSIDFQDLNFEKLAPFVGKDWPFSLIAAIKVTPLIPKRLKTRRLFWAFNDDIPQRWLHEALGVRDLAPFAFSVAHLSLATALCMGCDPIIFVGQDLSYTKRQGDHAQGTIIMQQGLPSGENFLYVPALGGGQVATDRGLLTLQKRFEDIIGAHPGRTYYNASAAGAHIQGTEAAALAALAPRYLAEDLPVEKLTDRALAGRPGFPVAALKRRIEAIRKEGKKIWEQLRETSRLAQEGRREVASLLRKRSRIRGFEALPKGMAQKLAKFDRRNRALDAAQALNEQVLELTYPALSENDCQRERNDAIRESNGYLPWLLAEIERIEGVNRERLKAFALYDELLERLDQGLAEEERYLNNQTATVQERLAQARSYAESGDYGLAQETLEPLLAGSKNSAALRLAGEVWAALLQFDRADACWRQADALEPGPREEAETARQRQLQGWLALADEHGNAGETADDQFPHLLPLWLGRVAALLSAEKEAPETLKLSWQRPAARLDKWLAAGENDPAELTLRGWETLANLLPEILIFKARLQAAQGAVDAAVNAVEQALRLQPRQPQWLALEARMLLEAGRFAEGIAKLQAAVALDPATASLWEELGDALAEKGDLASAIKAYQECLASLPQRWEVLIKIGHAYRDGGSWQAAQAAYQAVLARHPGQPEASRSLAALVIPSSPS